MIFVGVATLVWWEGKVLLGRRSQNCRRGPGMWGLPGGLMEWGETPIEAAYRETREEVGMAPRRMRRYETCPYSSTVYDGEHYITLYFEGDASREEVDLREPEKCDGWQWFAPDALPAPLFYPLQPTLLFPTWLAE